MPLRADRDYVSVLTDLESLRSARGAGKRHRADTAQPAASRDGPQGRIEIPFTELRVGMRVAKNITAKDDTVMLAAETPITQVIINLLSDLHELLGGERVSVYHPILEPKGQH